MNGKKKFARAARRLFRLCLVDGGLDDDRVRDVAQRLSSSGQRGAVPILAELQRLVRLDTERHTAVIESAAPLGADLREGIRTDLARRYGPAIRMSFEENPALIGGMRIKVGSDVYDDSIRARLAALEARL